VQKPTKKSAIEDTQLPFVSQQDFISLGPENGYEGENPLSNDEFEEEADRLLNWIQLASYVQGGIRELDWGVLTLQGCNPASAHREAVG
jgi:hypothetical protein